MTGCYAAPPSPCNKPAGYRKASMAWIHWGAVVRVDLLCDISSESVSCRDRPPRWRALGRSSPGPAAEEVVTAEVETRHGRIRGSESAGINAFRGIPYAAAPIGRRRFLPPAPPEPWSDVRDATRSGPAAPQFSLPVFSWLRHLKGHQIYEKLIEK